MQIRHIFGARDARDKGDYNKSLLGYKQTRSPEIRFARRQRSPTAAGTPRLSFESVGWARSSSKSVPGGFLAGAETPRATLMRTNTRLSARLRRAYYTSVYSLPFAQYDYRRN